MWTSLKVALADVVAWLELTAKPTYSFSGNGAPKVRADAAT